MPDRHPIDPATLAAVRRRSRQLFGAGAVAEAAELLDAATEAAADAWGAHHADVLTAAADLARMYGDSDAPQQARRVLESYLPEAARVRGDGDPVVVALAADLAAVADELGNRLEARRHHRHVAAHGPAALGAAHPAVLAARAYLAAMLPAAPPSPPPQRNASAAASGAAPSPTSDVAPRVGPAADDLAPARRPRPAAPSEGAAGHAAMRHPQSSHPLSGSAAAPSRTPPPPLPRARPGPEPPASAPRPAPPGRPAEGRWPPAASPSSAAAQPSSAPAHPPPLAGRPPPPLPHQLHGALPAQEPPLPAQEPLRPAPDLLPPRTHRLAYLLAGALAVVVLGAAATVGYVVRRAAPRPAPTSAPEQVRLTGAPPTGVRVAREPRAVVVTWRDPSAGRATFVVTGGQRGSELRLLAQVPAGSPTRYTAAGFHPRLAYCFQVSAVYSATEFGVAAPVCTDD